MGPCVTAAEGMESEMVEPGGRWKFERAHRCEANPLDRPQPLLMPGEELLYVKAYYRNRRGKCPALSASRRRFDITLPSDTLRLKMGIGRLLSFVGLAIELLIAGSRAADGAGFQLSASGSKKQIPISIILDFGVCALAWPVTQRCRCRRSRTGRCSRELLPRPVLSSSSPCLCRRWR